MTTSVTVGAGEGALFAADDFVRIDEEIMEVTVVTVDTLTVTRATLPASADLNGAGTTSIDSLSRRTRRAESP